MEMFSQLSMPSTRYVTVLELCYRKSEQGEFKRYTYDEKEYAASDVMNHLMYVERPLELCMEGHAIRVIDLRRWNITKERFDQLASDEYKYCMIQTKYLKPNPDDPNALVISIQLWKAVQIL